MDKIFTPSKCGFRTVCAGQRSNMTVLVYLLKKSSVYRFLSSFYLCILFCLCYHGFANNLGTREDFILSLATKNKINTHQSLANTSFCFFFLSLLSFSISFHLYFRYLCPCFLHRGVKAHL